MGYRSDVYLRVAEPLVEVVDLARKLDDKLDNMLKEASCEESKTDFCWEWVKWYGTYPEVQAVENLLEMLHDDDFGFIRHGEEDGDIDRKGCPGDYDMYVQTSIDW